MSTFLNSNAAYGMCISGMKLKERNAMRDLRSGAFCWETWRNMSSTCQVLSDRGDISSEIRPTLKDISQGIFILFVIFAFIISCIVTLFNFDAI